MLTVLKTCAAALSLVAIATPAAAESVSVSVYYGDLNLADERAMTILEGRLSRAIKRVCGTHEYSSVAIMYKTRKCRRTLHRRAELVVDEIRGGTVTVARNFVITDRG